jgi:hypothetical protein
MCLVHQEGKLKMSYKNNSIRELEERENELQKELKKIWRKMSYKKNSKRMEERGK